MRAILTYHSIDDSGSVLSVSREQLLRQAAWLASGPVEVVPLARIAGGSRQGDAVALTFDDGFRNFAELAWPILKDHGLPATLFVVGGRAGEDNRWQGREQPGVPALPLLDWPALERLRSDGLGIGSHALTHPRLSDLDDGALHEEVSGSRRLLEQRLGCTVEAFCYPYGVFDSRVRRAVAGCYRWACTTELRVLGAGDDPLALPRLDMFYYRSAGSLEAWGTTAFRARLWARARARALRRLWKDGQRKC